MKNFDTLLFQSIPEHDLAELNDCEKGAILETHKKLCQNRTLGQPEVLISRALCNIPGDERTVIDVVSTDRPFLVDSLVAEINRHSLLIDFLLHPFVYTEFDVSTDKFKSVKDKKTDQTIRQSHIHIRLHRLIPKSMEKILYRGLKRALIDVAFATDDWQDMRQMVTKTHDMLESHAPNNKDNKEYASFLDYIYDNNFTLLGYRYYKSAKSGFSAQSSSGLGLLKSQRDVDFLINYKDDLPALFTKISKQKKPLNIFKINRDSSVHRRVPVDAITVQDINDKGDIIGYHLFIGLFTSVTYSRSVTDIPYLRLKVAKVIDKSNFNAGSHDDKALRHILEKYPRDELFQTEVSKLHTITSSILSLQERQRVALYMRPDIFGKSVACMIYIPRDRFETRMRHRFEKVLEQELDGKTTAYYTTLDDSVFARIILLVESNKKSISKADETRLEKMLRQEGRAWDEILSEAINIKYGTDSDYFMEKYSEAFPIAYRETYHPAKALNDIEVLEKFSEDDQVNISFYRDKFCTDEEVRMKLYIRDEPVVLSDVLPILKNMGLRVISELPFKIKPLANRKNTDQEQVVWVHDFLMESDAKDLESRIPIVRKLAEVAFKMVWCGRMESDALNKLVLSAAMSWQEVKILRTYVHYIRQLGNPYSRLYISNALTNHPQVSRLLIDIFYARLDPAKEKESETYAKACSLIIQDELENVTSLDEDRILRSILNLVESTLRTNFFQIDEHGEPKDYLSIKIDSGKVEDMPEPKPYREIFVYSPRTEGIHLRGGPIARGGIRWSDRQEDYRTEVLGLMKAQMVKNAVIVPVGSKGGFIIKKPPKDATRKELQDEAIACYKILIRGLLDITDNRVGKKVVPPKNTVRHDGEDPYLVVAADKGTATFSDIANSISQEYGFWLDDAFASGGSAGYDHKVMGITARGAWESVMRHFSELNHDTQTQEFDVIGVGDMAGDVFGNGMILSKKICLVGAFNHIHIFCDPNPDPESTWKERERLFKEVKGWDAYDTAKLSKGGRIYLRSDKSLTLTPEIQKRFNITKEKVSPIELMHAMLKAKTDLLWFGGIGTYIKAESETDAQVGDKANDAIRVNADELHTKVIGEGANLAMTQLSRIEFAKNGGKLNADFIDNSGGVDSSDHEVNIKILLQAVMEDSKNNMTTKSRNKLLESMTETVAQHVLNNNRTQAEAISLMEIQAAFKLSLQADLIAQFEQDFGLNRKLEGLPDQESINIRMRLGKSLTRPELSTLQAYAKIELTKELLDTSIPDQPSLKPWLITYFPKQLHKKYEKEIKSHRLNREIIAMKLANNIVNRMGPGFVKNMRDQTGQKTEDVVKAYLIAKDIIDLPVLWEAINNPDLRVLAYVRLRALQSLSDLTQKITIWFLKYKADQLDIDAQVKQYRPHMIELQKMLASTLPERVSLTVNGRNASLLADGFSTDLANMLSLVPLLDSAPDIIQMSKEGNGKTDLKKVLSTYFLSGEFFGIDWLQQKSAHIETEDRWNEQAKKSQKEQLSRIHAQLSRLILDDLKSEKTISMKQIEKWSEQHADKTKQYLDLIHQFKRSGAFNLAMLTLASNSLQNICVR